MVVHFPRRGDFNEGAAYSRRTACGMPIHAAPFYATHDDPARVTCKRCARYKETPQPQEAKTCPSTEE